MTKELSVSKMRDLSFWTVGRTGMVGKRFYGRLAVNAERRHGRLLHRVNCVPCRRAYWSFYNNLNGGV